MSAPASLTTPLKDQLTARFGMAAGTNIEYSIDQRPDVHSVTLPLGGYARHQIADAGAAMSFGGGWSMAVARLIDAILPPTMLLRIDSDRNGLFALTSYLRFQQEPRIEGFCQLIERICHLPTNPAQLKAVSTALGCTGPRGIGLRGSTDGSIRLAVYFKVERDLSSFSAETVGTLLTGCGWECAGAPAIQADLRAVHVGGSVGVIGVDLDAAGAITALKCDPANVPLHRVSTFLQHKRAAAERLDVFGSMSRALRARSLSYLGIKYTPQGFAGWRLYFSLRPDGYARLTQPALFIDSPGAATLRMPHY